MEQESIVFSSEKKSNQNNLTSVKNRAGAHTPALATYCLQPPHNQNAYAFNHEIHRINIRSHLENIKDRLTNIHAIYIPFTGFHPEVMLDQLELGDSMLQ